MRTLILALCLTLPATVLAQPPILVDPSSGQFLGNLSSNPYGRYGSRYSFSSPNNPYAFGMSPMPGLLDEGSLLGGYSAGSFGGGYYYDAPDPNRPQGKIRGFFL
jgi:hypothetical protein